MLMYTHKHTHTHTHTHAARQKIDERFKGVPDRQKVKDSLSTVSW